MGVWLRFSSHERLEDVGYENHDVSWMLVVKNFSMFFQLMSGFIEATGWWRLRIISYQLLALAHRPVNPAGSFRALIVPMAQIIARKPCEIVEHLKTVRLADLRGVPEISFVTAFCCSLISSLVLILHQNNVPFISVRRVGISRS